MQGFRIPARSFAWEKNNLGYSPVLAWEHSVMWHVQTIASKGKDLMNYNYLHYTKTNKIPGKLLHKNISSHSKTCYLHVWKDHRCYDYIVNSAFRSNSEMVWDFIGVHVINRTLQGHLEIRNFSFRVDKYFTHSLCSLMKYSSKLEEKFRMCKQPCNILYFPGMMKAVE